MAKTIGVVLSLKSKCFSIIINIVKKLTTTNKKIKKTAIVEELMTKAMKTDILSQKLYQEQDCSINRIEGKINLFQMNSKETINKSGFEKLRNKENIYNDSIEFLKKGKKFVQKTLGSSVIIKETSKVKSFRVLKPIGQVVRMNINKLNVLSKKICNLQNIKSNIKNWEYKKTNKEKYNTMTTILNNKTTAISQYGLKLSNLQQNTTVVNKNQMQKTIPASNITINMNIEGNMVDNNEFVNELMNKMALELRKVLPA